MDRLPDFIIIGAMKCATSTLHDQLSLQPGIFMTTPKEPYFFSNDDVWSKGLECYKKLFDSASVKDLCGESSTHYTKLPTYPNTIVRMRSIVPDAKLIYIIRHPIDRLISHYIHMWSEKRCNESIGEAIVKHTELIDYSKYAMQLRPFLETYGPDNLILVFFEHLLKDPHAELLRIAKFIGYKIRPVWKQKDAANVSSQRMRSSYVRDAIVWNPLSTMIRRAFIPQSLRDWVKSFWQMKQRPQINLEKQRELEFLFDEDLAVLSKWIDIDLTCRTFKVVGKEAMPNWSLYASTPERKI